MINYNQPVFRPPAEGQSLILQVTLGCSWNKCSFCEMYTTKQFRPRSFTEIVADINSVAQSNYRFKKVFLADGNAFIITADKLLAILKHIQQKLGRLQRISSYALPSDILSKTDNELVAIRQAGLKLLYIGVESGCDDVLRLNNKSETNQTTRDGILKAQQAGFDVSVMILNGLGGTLFSQAHALDTACLMNEIQPKLLSSLVLSFPYSLNFYQKQISNNFEQLSPFELLAEMHLFLENTNLHSTIFRSDHASNYLALEGILGRDKEKMLEQIVRVLKSNDKAALRSEWMRGL